jgi:hypothetical protein
VEIEEATVQDLMADVCGNKCSKDESVACIFSCH